MGWFDMCRVNINASSVPHLCSYKIWDLKAWVKYCNRENQLKEGNVMSCTDHVVLHEVLTTDHK